MGIDLSITLNWTDKEEFYYLYYDYFKNKKEKLNRMNETNPELFDIDYVLYLLTYRNKPLYVGKTGINNTICNRWFNQKHEGLEAIMIKYPNPLPVKFSCAYISYSSSRRTKNVISTIEKSIIYQYEPEFNHRAKNKFSTTLNSIKVRNRGDCSPLDDFSMKFY